MNLSILCPFYEHYSYLSVVLGNDLGIYIYFFPKKCFVMFLQLVELWKHHFFFLFKISANHWSLIVFLNASQIQCVRHQDHRDTMVILVTKAHPIIIQNSKTVTQKLLFLHLLLLYHQGFCLYYMIWPSKWFKLVTSSNYKEFIGKKLCIWSIAM